MIRKQIYIAPQHEAKVKRLAKSSGRSEADIIREALEALPEEIDPVLNALIAQDLILPQEGKTTRLEARVMFDSYLKKIGKRHFGLTGAVLEDRSR
jgi:antitoxin ParD1/3/4